MAQNILYQKQKIYKKVLTGIGLSDIMITVPRGNKKGRKEKMFEVRRIDELGRIVIPKEIRKLMGIEAGAPMIITDENKNMVTFTKYDPNAISHDTSPSEILKNAISEMAFYAVESQYETEFYEIMDEVAKLMEECKEIENRD